MFELSEKRKSEDDDDVVLELPAKKRGRPLFLGEELDKKVKSYLNAMRSRGAVVNTSVVVGVANGIVSSESDSYLARNGGHIEITKHWAKNLLH